MTLAEELEKGNSERYALVKVKPSLRLNDLVTQKSGNIFETTFTVRYEVDDVLSNDTSLTESSTANPGSNEYYYDADSGQFEINVGANPITTEIQMVYVLRFTDSEKSTWTEDGLLNQPTSYFWEPRLRGAPAIDISVKNFVVGLMTITATDLRFVNNDEWFQDYLAGENNWHKKDLFIDLFVNEERIAKYQGKVTKAKPSGDIVTLTIYDTNAGLNDPALLGDIADEAYYSIDNFGTNFDRSKEGQIIPYVINRSPHKFILNTVNGTGYREYYFDPTEMPQAVSLDIFDSLTWGLCRVSESGVKQLDYGTVTNIVASAAFDVDYGTGTANRRSFQITTALGSSNIEIGDTIEIEKSSTLYGGIVTDIGTNTGATVDLIRGFMNLGAPSGTYDNETATPTDCIGVMIIQNGIRYFPDARNDYSLSVETLSSGNKFYKIVFNGFFWTNHPGMVALNYLTDQVYFRFTEDTESTDRTEANQVMQKFVESAGLTWGNSGSGPVGANVSMMIPGLGQNDVEHIGKYVGDLAQSTVSFIYQDFSDLATKFTIFQPPSASPSGWNVLPKEEIIGLAFEVDGNEMGLEIRVTNDQTFFYYTSYDTTGTGAQDFEDEANVKTVAHTISSDKSKYQYGLTNTINRDSVLTETDFQESRVKALIENEQLYVTFSTSTRYANLKIGDTISPEDTRIPGPKQTIEGRSVTPLRILGMRISADSIRFTCINLKGY